MSDDTFSDVTADEIQLLEVLERMDAEGIAITGAITRAHLEADKPAEGDHDEGQNPGTSPARKLQMCFERMSEENRQTLLRTAEALLLSELNQTREITLRLVAANGESK